MKNGLTALTGTMTLLVGAKAALAQNATTTVGRTMAEDITRTGVWMVIAILLFMLAYKFADLMTPGDLKTQLAEGNTALAIFAGSIIIGFALIIAQLVS